MSNNKYPYMVVEFRINNQTVSVKSFTIPRRIVYKWAENGIGLYILKQLIEDYFSKLRYNHLNILSFNYEGTITQNVLLERIEY